VRACQVGPSARALVIPVTAERHGDGAARRARISPGFEAQAERQVMGGPVGHPQRRVLSSMVG